MNVSLLTAYTLAVLLLLVTPGPVVALITATAARDGRRRAFATLVGTNSASLMLMLLAMLMLLGLVALSPLYLSLLGIAGSLYIGWSALAGLVSQAKPCEAVNHRGGVIRGFLTGIANPKDILFFVAFFPQFIAVTDNFAFSMATLSLVWTVLDVLVLSLYILAVTKWLPGQHHRRLERLSSLILLAIAAVGLFYNVGEMSTHYH
ncbi:LysE family translocator [Kluyvera genomosp. 1]|uniref:LysE family translocator n=1 Tax=Kluyvera genomosp. 1 TaxID=2774053 RepID=UPI0006893D73|nr:LysE family translocator [Kluyvera genomosp. 1]